MGKVGEDSHIGVLTYRDIAITVPREVSREKSEQSKENEGVGDSSLFSPSPFLPILFFVSALHFTPLSAPTRDTIRVQSPS